MSELTFDSLREKVKGLNEVKTRNQVVLENAQKQADEYLEELKKLGYNSLEEAEEALVALEEEMLEIEKNVDETYALLNSSKIVPPTEEEIMKKIHEKVLEGKKAGVSKSEEAKTPPVTATQVVETPPVTATPVVETPPVAAQPVVDTPPVTATPVVETPPVAAQPVVDTPPVTATQVVETPPVAAQPTVTVSQSTIQQNTTPVSSNGQISQEIDMFTAEDYATPAQNAAVSSNVTDDLSDLI